MDFSQEATAREHFRKAEELFRQDRFPEALQEYRTAAALSRSLWVKSTLFVGDCCYRMEQFFVALEIFREITLVTPREYEAWRYAGDSLGDLGRLELAAPYYAKAFELRPGHWPLVEAIEGLQKSEASMAAFYKGQDKPGNPVTFLQLRRRLANCCAELHFVPPECAAKILLFYREWLLPANRQRVQSSLQLLSSGAQSGGAAPLDAEIAAGIEALEDDLRKMIEQIDALAASGIVGGPPQPYRFGPADGAPSPTVAELRDELKERKTYHEPKKTGEAEESEHLRVRAIERLDGLLAQIPSDAYAAAAAPTFAPAISDALANRDYEDAEVLAVAEMELMMSLATPGLADCEKLLPGHGVSPGNRDFDVAGAMEQLRKAAGPDEAYHLAQQAGWHAETIVNALCFSGPRFYVLYLADYRQAYELARKMVRLCDLVPERLGHFQLGAFYRLQALAALQEATEKQGLHEETINAGLEIIDIVAQLGPNWNVDLPQLPGMLLGLDLCKPPVHNLARAGQLLRRAYEALGRDEEAAASVTPVATGGARDTGKITSRDCMDLVHELAAAEQWNGALQYAHLALALDERKYRQADYQFQANRALTSIAMNLGLERLPLIYQLRALAAALEMGIPFNILYCYGELADILEDQQELAGAEYFASKAVAQIDAGLGGASMKTSNAAISAQFQLARLLETKSPEEAERRMLGAIEILEGQRQAIQHDRNAAGFGHVAAEIYAALIDLTLKGGGREQAALELLERSKIRALLDRLAENAPGANTTRSPANLAQIQEALTNS